jgi:hypothetical protein
MNKVIINKDCTITRLGVIDDNDGDLIENAVELSEKNFRLLISMIPKIDTHNAMNNELQSIKDSCTQLSMKADLKRTDIIDMLTSAINYEQFISDVNDFRKQPDIKVVGKIDLSKFKNEIQP